MPKSKRTSEMQASLDLLRSKMPPGLNLEKIGTMKQDDLLRLQQHFQLGGEWGIITVPSKWTPPSQRLGDYRWHFFRLVQDHICGKSDIELAVITLVRLFLLHFLFPGRSGFKSGGTLSFGSLRQAIVEVWLPAVRIALKRPERLDGHLLARLSRVEATDLSNCNRTIAYINRLENFHREGLWDDFFTVEKSTQVHPSSNRGGTSKKEAKGELKSKGYLPFPDAFTMEAGYRAGWIIRNLMPEVLQVYESILALRGKVCFSNTLSSRGAALLADYKWTLNGQIKVPFLMDLQKSSKETSDFPPRNLSAFNNLLVLCQTAVYFIVGLSAGPRASEILSFRNDCLVERNGSITVVRGLQFKVSESFSGEERDWPMPSLAIEALQKQIQLTGLVEREYQLGRNVVEDTERSLPLWRLIGNTMGKGGDLKASYNKYLRNYSRRLHLDIHLDNQALTNHRFRSTIGRLVALSMSHAPKIMMDIYGHRDIEMTMAYLTKDKTIRAQAIEIQKEIQVMIVEKAIRNISENGGKAARKIINIVAESKLRDSKDTFGTDDIHEIAVRQVAIGQQWSYVREGVVCTKREDQVGPCALSQSRPNPSRCTTHCTHRLEEPDNLQQADDVLHETVLHIQQAQAEGDIIKLEAWIGQFQTHVRRFDSLYRKWSVHPVAMAILTEDAEEVTNAA